jgi:RNA polymerase sigma-70 factor (ECF subfamily)
VEDQSRGTGLTSVNEDDFRLLVERHQARVINTCYGFLGTKEDAEDAAQEVFIEVFRSLNSFRNESMLSTWIYRIAVTRSLDAVRARNRVKRLGHLKRLLGLDDAEGASPEHLAPDVQLEEKERLELLLRAIEALPENQRVAVTLAKLEGFTYAEVAGIMETSLSSVESLLFRGRKNLEKTLTRYFARQPAEQPRSAPSPADTRRATP